MSDRVVAALELIDLPVCRTDARFRMLWENGAFVRRFGTVRGFLDIVREDELIAVRDQLAEEEKSQTIAHAVRGFEAARVEWRVLVEEDGLRTFVASAPTAYQRRVDMLERMNRQLEEFVYVVSHDLNEPLRMVTSFTQLLEEDYGDALDDEAKTYIKFANEGAEKMRHLLTDLLSYSRINTRGKPFEPFDVKHALDNAAERLHDLLDGAEAKIVVDGELGVVRGDRGQVVELFVQLLKNAVQFRSEAPPVIEVASEALDGWRRYSVTDNGIGLDAKQHERMLQIFKRLRPREGTGTGVGLALCRRIVERHGGTLALESPEDRAGLRVVCTLPAVAQP